MTCHIQALPLELMSEVLLNCGSLQEISRVRCVSRFFMDSCDNVLCSVFLNLKNRVRHHTELMRKEADFMIEQYMATKKRRWFSGIVVDFTMRLHQIRLMDSFLHLVHACTWNYIWAGVSSFFFGSLLDAYQKLVDEILNERSALTVRDIQDLQVETLRFLQFFHTLCKENLIKVRRKKQVILPSVTLIAVLEACFDKKRSTPILQHSKWKKIKNAKNIYHLKVSYNLGCCVLAVQNSMKDQLYLTNSDIFLLCQVMTDLVWLSNNEYLESQWLRVDRKMNHSFPERMLKRIDEGRLSVHYGIGKHVRSWQNLNNPDRPLLIHIDAICDISLLPLSLLQSVTIRLPEVFENRNCRYPSPFKFKMIAESVDWPEYPPISHKYEYRTE